MGPLTPGFCTYGYAIDGGLRMPDPSNPDLELRRWGPTSMFIVPGNAVGGETGLVMFRRLRAPRAQPLVSLALARPRLTCSFHL